jgi:hypothetical protein
VQTETSELAQVVDSRKIQELPLNGRNYLQLGITTPGVIVGLTILDESAGYVGRVANLWVSGQRVIQTGYSVDGIETRNDRFGIAAFRPSIDMIEEFKLDRNAFGVTFGNDSSAEVNLTTKAGGNDFHGTAYEFLRNNVLDSRNYFDTNIPPFRQNDFGGSFGGRLIKNKLFFFGTYEGFRQHQGNTLYGLVPSPGQLQGNLADNSGGTGYFPTDSSDCISNPSNPQCKNIIDPTTGQPFPDNMIPSTRISHYASIYNQYIPAPNALNKLPLYNLEVAPSTVNNYDQWSARIDHVVSDKDTVFYRFLYDQESLLKPGLQLYSDVSLPLTARNFVVGWTRSFSPSLVNVFRGGYNRSFSFSSGYGSGPGFPDLSAALGLKNTSSNPYDTGLPNTSFIGYSGFGSGTLSIGNLQQSFQFTDMFDWVRGKHTISVGGEYRRYRYWQLTDSPGKPSFSFSGNYTGSSIGDYLLGDIANATQSVGDSSQNIRVNFFALFVSDFFKATPNLTFNYGLRWDYKSPPTEINNRQAILNFKTMLIDLACHEVPCTIWNRDLTNFGPRLGFAYRPFGSTKTVIRAGFGMYWVQEEANNYQFLVLTPPFYTSETLTSTLAVPQYQIDNLFPPPVMGTAASNVLPFTRLLNEKRPYSPEWNFTVRHQFTNDWSLEVSYQGSASVRYGSYGNYDAATTLDPTGTIPLSKRVPYPQFGGILVATSDAHGNYNAGTISLNKRFSQGLTLVANYTYAKSIDNSSEECNFTSRPAQGRIDMRGPSDFDIPQEFVLSYVYDLPIGKGKRFLANTGGLTNAVLGNWELTGITTFMSGVPQTVDMPGDYAGLGWLDFTRASCVGNPSVASVRNNVRKNNGLYFDTSAFAAPPLYTMGNCGRNTLRDAGLNNWDASLDKTVKIGEKLAVQLRFEFFNTWNHAQWGQFGGSYNDVEYGSPGYGNPTFGYVTSARAPRNFQVGMKFIF